MALVATRDNPIPSGALEETIEAADGVKLRAARWLPESGARGTLAILTGRAEAIEKYFEVIGELLSRNFAVAIFDWRGQGGSARPLRNARKGHVDDFADFERDLDGFYRWMSTQGCPRPWFALGHSMGAAILLAAAEGGRAPFDRLVLTAPMFALVGVRRPRTVGFFLEALDALGLGGAFAPGGGATSASTVPFDQNVLTSDRNRYERVAGVLSAEPSLGLGWPTIGWLHAAFRLMRRFEDPDFTRAVMTPVLIVASGADRVTDTRAAERVARRLRAGRIVVIEGAEHEILMERDALRDQFWSAFDQFAPGAERRQGAAVAS